VSNPFAGQSIESARRALAAQLRSSGLDEAELDARLLLGAALGLDLTGLIVQSARTKGRFVLVTGDGDPEADKMKAVADLGFRRDRFNNVTLLLVPGIAQATPEASTLEQALALLEASASTNAAPHSKYPQRQN